MITKSFLAKRPRERSDHYDRVKTLVGVAQFLQEIRGASQICTVPPVHQEPLPPLHKRQTELDRGISKLLQLVVER
jgi:hypothetical protein